MIRVRLAALVAAAGLAFAGCGGGSSTPSSTPTDSQSSACAAASATYKSPPPTLPAATVTLSTSPPPWAPPVITDAQGSAQYVAAAGLPCSEEMLQVHYHAHLDINVNGTPVVVSQYVGFVAQGNKVVGLAPLHTHDASGIIHIENSLPATFYLGQFFIEWGVRFTKACLGPYCAGKGKELAVFVDGTRYTGDPTQLLLKKHEEISIEYGTAGKLPPPPSSYTFPSGL